MSHTTQNPNGDALQSMLKESIHRFLTEYRKGRTDFSNFTSIFSRFLNGLPDPPLEIIWFYSALTFHSAKFTAQHSSVANDLFKLLVSCSSSCNAVTRIAVLAPVIYELSSSVRNRKGCVKEIESLLEVIVSYISICCSSNFAENDGVMVLNSCFLDSVCIWVVDKIGESCQFSEALRVFFPLVNDGIRKRFVSDGYGIEVGYLAGIVMSQSFLLNLCLKFESRVSRVEFDRELQDWVVQTMTAFRSYYFFDTILRMLLEPILPVTSLPNPEDEVILREILYDAAMIIQFSCFDFQKGFPPCDGHLKNLAITWLLVADNAIRFLRENGDKTKVISYMQAFSESCLPSILIKWVTNQPGIQNVNAPKVSTPLAIIRWLLIVEDQGARVFDCDISKIHAKTIVCKSKKEYEFFVVGSNGKNLNENHLPCGCNDDKGDDEVDGDLKMCDSDDNMLLATRGVLKATATNRTRKRKEERNDEGDKQVKFFKCHVNDNWARDNASPLNDNDTSSSGSEVDDPTSDEHIVYMEQ